jgi:RimJ/RimL family protein N-acetyltransferase
MTFHRESEQLILRQFRKTDTESFLAYRNDPEVARYQGWSVPYPRESAVEFIQKMSVAVPIQGKWMQVALELKSSGDMIGDVAFFIKHTDERQALIGYSLARPYWGNGYASEAVACLVGYLFDELNLHRVIAECDVENLPSWKLLEKLGFRREAHLVENIFFKGAYGSEYHYGMLAREWKEICPAQ